MRQVYDAGDFDHPKNAGGTQGVSLYAQNRPGEGRVPRQKDASSSVRRPGPRLI